MELKQDEVGHDHHDDELLIVPYGIETILCQMKNLCYQTFNRTLWN
ncbi:Uncharacterised protein [uncultured Bacteroides sp.]|nr:Uncharacterised protein [uncultured Bacteroides sp.]